MIKEHTMPCIHMNGSGETSLRRQYNELFEAVSEAQIKLLFDTDFHGIKLIQKEKRLRRQ